MKFSSAYFMECQKDIYERNQKMKNQSFSKPKKQKSEGEKINEEMEKQGIKTFFK